MDSTSPHLIRVSLEKLNAVLSDALACKDDERLKDLILEAWRRLHILKLLRVAGDVENEDDAQKDHDVILRKAALSSGAGLRFGGGDERGMSL